MSARVLIHVARENLFLALQGLVVEEEYLREALEEQLHGLDVLLDKVRVEEALLRDREVLLSEASEGLGEHLDAERGTDE
jgi:hypothetical protein